MSQEISDEHFPSSGSYYTAIPVGLRIASPPGWRIPNCGSARYINSGLSTVDPLQEPMEDEVCGTVSGNGLETTRAEGRRVGAPFPAVILADMPPEEGSCWGTLLQDTLEPRPPLSAFVSVREPGELTSSRGDACESLLIPKSDKPNPTDVPPTFSFFGRLPFELRLKIWHLTIQPRLVHWNTVGGKRSWLKIDPKLPAILQVCRESREEGFRMYDINPKATRSFFLNPAADTLIWTRYPRCARTAREDAQRLRVSSTLQNVRHLATLLKSWNSFFDRGELYGFYVAFRKAPNLEVLTLVDDYVMGRTAYSQITHGRVVKLLDTCAEDIDFDMVSLKEQLREEGKEQLWSRWDRSLNNKEGIRGIRSRKFPEIILARIVWC